MLRRYESPETLDYLKTKGFGNKVPPFLLPLLQRFIHSQAWSQGMGRHSREEIYRINLADIQALSDFLGGWTILFINQDDGVAVVP